MQGCATFTPQTITCESGGLVTVTDTGQRVSARGYSVLPPSGGHWCIGAVSDSQISFATNPYLGKYIETPPTKEQFMHTFVAAAASFKVKTSDISSQSELKSFMERWLENGRTFKAFGPEFYIDWEKYPATKTLDFHVETDDSLKADCVRFRHEWEEQANPKFPNWVLITTSVGIACRHPASDRMFVTVEFSDRRRLGYDNPEARGKLGEQADSTIQSLEFTAL